MALRFLLMLIVIVLSCGVMVTTGEPLSIAVFESDVTPPPGSPLCHGHVQPVRKVADPLRARGIVLMGAGDPIVLCAVDWVGIGNDGYEAWREVLAEAAVTTPERVAVHAVHLHDAPACDFSMEAAMAEHGLGGRAFNVTFAREAIARAGVSLRRALETPRPVTHVGTGQATVERVASTRRVLGPDGKVQYMRFSSCTQKAAVESPEGLVDPVLRQVSFWEEDHPIVVLTYYACHPMTFYGKGVVSADIVGLVRGLRDCYVPEALHIYFNGAGGDIALGKYNQRKPAQRLEMAARLAGAMEQAFENVRKQPIDASDVEWRVQPIRFPQRKGLSVEGLTRTLSDPAASYRDRMMAARNLIWLKRCLRGDAIDLTCLRVGPARIVHLPGEPFVQYQLSAQEMRPDGFVCVAGYGEYGTGYIGTAAAYDQGGYETSDVSRVGPDAEPLLLSAIEDLLK